MDRGVAKEKSKKLSYIQIERQDHESSSKPGPKLNRYAMFVPIHSRIFLEIVGTKIK